MPIAASHLAAPPRADEAADSSGLPVGTNAVTHTTLLQTEGPGVLFILAVPLVLTLVGSAPRCVNLKRADATYQS